MVTCVSLLVISATILSCGTSGGVSESKVNQLLTQMTLQEKSGMLHGTLDPNPDIGVGSAGYVSGVPRLGIPPLRLADGPAGIRTLLPATALPSPIGLAASFDPQLAFRYGEVIGVEGKARNQDVLLSPMVNIIRVPFAGRNFETFGEDPELASQIVAAEIKGIQSKGLMATVKHYIANNQEDNRYNVDARVDERTLREIYLPGFVAAINADVASIMCAYNQVNGYFACENPTLLTSMLRDEFNYNGFVMTDWWARHSLDALQNGLNLEMPGYSIPAFDVPSYFSDALIAAVNSGNIGEASVDKALRPMLVKMLEYGFLDAKNHTAKKALDESSARNVDVDAHANIALEAAINSAVLLKNDNNALPLSNNIRNLVVVGPTAQHALIGGGGSSRVVPFRRNSPLQAIQQIAGTNTEIVYHPGINLDGVPIPPSALKPASEATSNGLILETNGTTSITDNVDFVGNNALTVDGVLRWKGYLIAKTSGSYELNIQTRGGQAQLSIDGNVISSTSGGALSQASLIPTQLGLANSSAKINLEAGRHYAIEIEANTQSRAVFQPTLTASQPFEIRLAWSTPEQQQAHIADAAAAAQNADAVVVFAYIEGTEGSDRKSLTLPGHQDELIAALAKTKPKNLIVVLNVGAPVTMPWKNDIDAILQMWYPGQEGGEATASLLFGQANPSGKLPVTFPKSDKEIPINTPLQYPGVDGRQDYSEGLYVGYRWYDQHDVEPLFPFGHGLSYSTFTYSELRVSKQADSFDVAFTVTNSSNRTGAEVAQLYLGNSDNTTVNTEQQKLVDFKKVTLNPGEQTMVRLTIDRQALSFWDVGNHTWSRLPGTRAVNVGSSSRDFRLTTAIKVE